MRSSLAIPIRSPDPCFWFPPGHTCWVDKLTQLLLDARDGNDRALDAFVRATQDDVWRLCRHLGDSDNVDDLAQEVFVRAIRSMPRFRRDGSAKSWLLTIARNTCADAARSRGRWRKLRDHGEAPEVGIVDADQAMIDDLLASLRPERREAFVLTQLLGCGYAEAAAVIGCPIGTVRSRVARARDDLLRIVADEHDVG